MECLLSYISCLFLLTTATCVYSYEGYFELVAIEAPSMRDGLQRFLCLQPLIQAIFIGTRRTDPFAGTIEAKSG
jgi:hypothetical protein